MSFEGQVDWKRKLIGPVWPFEIIGKPSVAAPAVAAAAPARNLRREAVSVFLGCSLLIRSSNWKALGRAMRCCFSWPPRSLQVNDSRGGFVPAPALQVYGAQSPRIVSPSNGEIKGETPAYSPKKAGGN